TTPHSELSHPHRASTPTPSRRSADLSRALGIPRSRLSRRVRQLENKYDAVLIQRSTRQFSVTDLGQEFYERGVAALIEADAARENRKSTRLNSSHVSISYAVFCLQKT